MNCKTRVIFADCLSEKPQYLCETETGKLFVCTVTETKSGYEETDTAELSQEEALTFIAGACRKAFEKVAKKNITQKGKIESTQA